MDERRLAGQIRGILRSHGLEFEVDGRDFALRFNSAVVRISIAKIGGQLLIHIRSVVLSELSITAESKEQVLRSVNQLNAEHLFGRWAFYGETGTICLEYDLLGDHLQAAELMTALAAIARQADREDDPLQQLIGGKRAIDLAPEVISAERPIDPSPVIETLSVDTDSAHDPSKRFLQLLAAHKSKNEIARELGMPKAKVSKTITALAKRFEVPEAKRGEIVDEAKRRGII